MFLSLLTVVGFQVVTTEGPVSHHEKVDTEEPPTSPSSSLKVNTSPNTTKQDLNHASANNSGFSCAMMDPWMSDFYVPDCESFTWLEVIVIDTWQGKVLYSGCLLSSECLCIVFIAGCPRYMTPCVLLFLLSGCGVTLVMTYLIRVILSSNLCVQRSL